LYIFLFHGLELPSTDAELLSIHLILSPQSTCLRYDGWVALIYCFQVVVCGQWPLSNPLEAHGQNICQTLCKSGPMGIETPDKPDGPDVLDAEYVLQGLVVDSLRINRAIRKEAQWLADVLNREGQSLGTRAILGEDLRLALQWGGA
jgi:hypothetical protein